MDGLLKSVNFPFDTTTGLIDRQGGAWICTREHGIFYISPGRLQAETVQSIAEIQKNEAYVIDNQGRQWQTGTEGLMCHTGDTVIYYKQAGTVSKHISNIREVAGLLHNNINFIAPLPDGRLLLCNMKNALGYFSPEECRFVCLNERLSAINRYRYLVGICPLIEQNRVLVYAQNGAFILDTKADTICNFIQNDKIYKYSDKYNCVLLDRNKRLWVGTQNGLFVMDATVMSDKECRVTKISGLANDCIRSLVEDGFGDIWVGTSCGISRVAKGVTNLDESNGVPNVPMVERAAYCLADGRIAFRNSRGFTVFHPSWFTDKTGAPSVVVVGMSIRGRHITDDNVVPYNFAYDQNDIVLQFSALNYVAPTHTHYRCRLHGLKDEWQMISDGDLATVTYYALPPGNYTFEAQAEVDDGGWGKPLKLTFRIRPPWWITWWAKGFYALVALLAIYCIVVNYLARKKAHLIAENDERVNRLFELRDEARHRFAENININPAVLTSNTSEEKLVRDLLTAIETNLGNVDYTVDMLAMDVGIGRTKLYTVMRNILGITPNDFLRAVRLKRAAQLLENTSMPISEVALQTGFNTPRYFSSHFKNMFGVLPSEYRDGDRSRNHN